MRKIKFQIPNFKLRKKKTKILIVIGGILIVLLTLLWFFGINPTLKLKANAQKAKKILAESRQALAEKNLIYLKEKTGEISSLIANTQNISKKLAWLKIIPCIGGYYQNGKLALESSDYLSQASSFSLC